jgi:hypothetical protein
MVLFHLYLTLGYSAAHDILQRQRYYDAKAWQGVFVGLQDQQTVGWRFIFLNQMIF